MEDEIKFGIKHNEGVIIAISKFPDGEIPEGFEELSEAEYLNFLEYVKQHPFATYIPETRSMTHSAAQEIEAERKRRLRVVRDQLLLASNELSLSSELEEEAGELQAEFNRLKAEYDSLKGDGG